METKYGIISDIHEADIKEVLATIDILKNKGIKNLVLNGDITGDRFPHMSNQDYLASILDHLGRSGLEADIVTGSHEEVTESEPAIKYFMEKYNNLRYAISTPKIEKEDHDLVFLPGSDWRPGNISETGFSLESGENKSGLYETQKSNILRIINMNDLRCYSIEPERTILFSHVPGRFYNGDFGVDMAEFYEAEKDFCFQGNVIEKGSVIPFLIGKNMNQEGLSLNLRRENRGNIDLENLIKELGIRKHITAHFHESVHRAHDSSCNQVKQGEFVDELFWMASHQDEYKIGILTVRANKVSYENMELV